MKRLSRSDSSMTVASSSLRAAWGRAGPRSRSVLAAPRTESSGVRRSWLMEVRSARASRSVSAARSARSRSA